MDDKIILKLLFSENSDDFLLGMEYLMKKEEEDIKTFFDTYGTYTLSNWASAISEKAFRGCISKIYTKFYQKGKSTVFKGGGDHLYLIKSNNYDASVF